MEILKANLKMEILRILTMTALFILFLIPVHDYMDCHDGYVEECLDCQENNMTYALCSGMCYEPVPEDLTDRGCSVHPSQDCEVEIPENYCVIEYYRWRLGILQLWGESTYSHGGY